MWNASVVQKHFSYTWQEGLVWSIFLRRHLEEKNEIKRSHEESYNINKRLESTRRSPQSQIAPTAQKDKSEVTFIRSCA